MYSPGLLCTCGECSLCKIPISSTSLRLPLDSEPRPAASPGGDPCSKEPGSLFAGPLPMHPSSPCPGVSWGAQQVGLAAHLPLLPPSCHPKECPVPLLEPSFAGSSCSRLSPVSPAVSGVCLLLKSGIEMTCVLKQEVLWVDLPWTTHFGVTKVNYSH